MDKPRLGPRWLAPIVLAFGLLEVPWVIYLIFFQQRTGTAYHSHLTALGLSVASAVMTGLAAYAAWTGRRTLPVYSVMSATLLLDGVGLALLLSELHVMVAGVVGGIVAIIAAYRALRHGEFTSRWIAVVLAVVVLFIGYHLWTMFTTVQPTFAADHLRLLVVAFDTAETVSLIGLGLALMKGRAKHAIVFGAMGVVLFLTDAWVNILAVPPGKEFVAAIFYAVVGELPSTAMCAAGLVLGMRNWSTSEQPALP